MDLDLNAVVKDLSEKGKLIEGSTKNSLVNKLSEDQDLLLANAVMLESIAQVLLNGPKEASRAELKDFASMYNEFKDLFSEVMEE